MHAAGVGTRSMCSACAALWRVELRCTPGLGTAHDGARPGPHKDAPLMQQISLAPDPPVLRQRLCRLIDGHWLRLNPHNIASHDKTLQGKGHLPL